MVGELATLITYIEKESGTYLRSALLYTKLMIYCLDAQKKLAQAKLDKAAAEAKLETLKRLRSTLDSQTTDIDDICSRLDQFATIWNSVGHPHPSEDQ